MKVPAGDVHAIVYPASIDVLSLAKSVPFTSMVTIGLLPVVLFATEVLSVIPNARGVTKFFTFPATVTEVGNLT